MAHTVAEALEWARAHPTKTVGEGGPSWNTWCAALVFWAGGFSRSFMTAMLAGDYAARNNGLNPDWRSAPPGAINYWAGVGGEGHTSIDVGNDHTQLMASGSVSNFGRAIGTIRFADYGLPHYRGWSMRWGDETLAGTASAGGGFIPLNNITPSEDDMVIYEALNSSSDGLIQKGNCYVQGADGPLRWVSGLEKGSYDYWAANGIPYRRAPWAGEDIRKLVSMVGLLNLGAQSSLNGQILIGSPVRVVRPGEATVNLTPAQVSALADELSKKIAGLDLVNSATVVEVMRETFDGATIALAKE